MVENPAQPLVWNGSTFTASNYVGNSAVLKFAQDVTRPASGTKTLYVSYLFSLAPSGQLGTGNNGRYLGFLSATNLSEGWNPNGSGPVSGAFYTNWFGMFNTFNSPGGTNRYACHGLLADGSSYYIGACDSAIGKNWPSTPFVESYNAPIFVVGEYVLNSGANLDTNIVWVNPATGSFGGATPPASGNHVLTLTNFTMSDLGGLVFIDRVGNGASGGVGTNYVANLIIGSTWSYVTGGPEFTNQPLASTTIALGGSGSITGTGATPAGATAAGQTVSYQWVKIVGGVTNVVNPGNGGAGGSAFVSGQNTATLSLNNISAGDAGNYQLVATASGTGYILNSVTAAVVLPDPLITASPANATANYGQTATFTATATTAYAPLHYGWYFNGTPMQNGTQADGQTVAVNATGTTAGSSPFTITLTLNNITYQDAGSYYLVVTNSLDLQASSSAAPATLAVNDPIITAQPANPVVTPGNNATFTVVAAGSPSPSTTNYQWYEGTAPSGTQLSDGGTTVGGLATVSGSQTPTLTLTGVQDADNGNYYCAITGSGSGQTTYSTAASLIVQDPLTIISPPMSLTERAGDHVAFSVGVSGGGPQLQWYGPPNGTILILGATNNALALTNIQTSNNGTYRVAVGNAATAFQNYNATLTVINGTVLNLLSANLVVARVGDGAQTLSGATGNTLYLDQYTTNGSYVNSTQIPDEGTGQPYGTGSSSGAGTSPALLVAGAGSDAGYEAMLNLSGFNQEYLCFAGYCEAYPFSGPDVTAGGTVYPTPYPRGLATVNAFGVYSLAYTNGGLYSGGNHTIRSMVTSDGTNFWTVGQAGSGTVKFGSSSTGSTYASGSGVPSSSGVSGAGGRNIQIVNGPLPGFSSGPNLVVSDAGQSGNVNNGLWAASGLQEPAANGNIMFTALLYTGAGQPGDFAFSPDNQTIYVAESAVWTGTGPGTGGIERWDSNGSGYSYSYTLPALPGGTATNGAQGLTVDFSSAGTWGVGITGAKIYATSTGTSGNSLVEIVDNGASSTPTVLATAGPNQALRGVRFGPTAIAPAIAGPPQTNTVPLGNPATFSVVATGSAPLFYQWYFGSTPLAGATQSSFTTNNVSYASAGNYKLVVSNLTMLVASVTNVLVVTAGIPTISPLPSYTETAGDHLAWAPVVTGTQPYTNYWYSGSTLVQSNVTPGANGSLALTNIQPANNGTYTLVVSNFYGHTSASALLTVTTTRQNLSATNLVVTRVGDGAQALSSATGNTLYLDQYTPGGGYVNTIQVPDEGTGQPYGTGSSSSSSMPFGSPALLVAGAGSDASYEALLTLAPNQETLSFAGYCQSYPFAGADVTVSAGNGGNQWRGVGTVNAYGYYTLGWTNSGLYSEGNHTVHSAFDIDGNGINFYTAGQAGGGNGIKYCDPANELCPGTCIPGIAGSFPGTRVVQVVGGNLVFSDAGAGVSTNGIYACLGLPTAGASSGLMIAETNSPMDFAASPDLQTVYIADNGAFGGTSSPAGGIQRWDASGTSPYGYPTYGYSYTLGTGGGSAMGARGLTVDFSAAGTWGTGVTGAKIYATTAEAAGNRLIKIVDTGAASSAAVLTLAGSNQILAGVRLGPVVVPPSFAVQPQATNAVAGSSATFSVEALGSGPMTYQWYFQPNCTGSFHAINLATNATYAINSAGSGNVGCYYVVVTNPGGATLQSDTAAFTLSVPPQFVLPYPGPGNSYQLNFTGQAGFGYTIWTSTDVSLTPVQSYWSQLTTGTFSGGVDSFTDPNGGVNPQQFYKITSP